MGGGWSKLELFVLVILSVGVHSVATVFSFVIVVAVTTSEKRISSNNPTARSNVCRTDACLLHNLLLFSRLVGLLRDLCCTSMCCRHTMSQSGPMILALTWQKLPERKARKVYTTDMQPHSRHQPGHCRARCKPYPQFWHTCQQQHFCPCPR